jgi:hypothetical protein
MQQYETLMTEHKSDYMISKRQRALAMTLVITRWPQKVLLI